MNNVHSNGKSRNPLFPDPPNRFDSSQVNQFNDLVTNVIAGRSELFKSIFGSGGGERNIWAECRYPLVDNLSAQIYRNLYDVNSIARRVVELYPKECWQQPPTITEDDGAKNTTDFEEAIDELGQQLNPQGQRSWVQDDGEVKGSPLWSYLERADILSGIGQFGVLLLGLDDGRNLQDPADGIIPILNNRYIPDSPPSKQEIDEIRDIISGKMVVNVGGKDRSVVISHGYRSHEEFLENYHKRADDILNNYKGKGGGSPGDGAIIIKDVMGTDANYDWQSGLGMKSPEGASLSGTDQQYFGVMFGPSERFQDKPPKDKRKLLFMRPFDESLVQVVRYEWNIRNPRFGLPVMYRITLNDPRQPHSGVGLPLATVYVHWSRLLHFADNLVVSEIFGTPRMRPVLPEIFNVEKVKNGGAEGYWRSCFVGLALKTHPQLGGDVAIDKRKLDQMMDEYYSEMNRVLMLMGMDVDTIAPDVVDPTPHINVNIQGICIQLACPNRVFMGSERGELASSQDDEAWNERKMGRQNGYISPKIIVPFIDRLIQLGVLPEPDHYKVQWPDLDALGDKDKAAIGLQTTQSLQAYVAGNVEAIMPVEEYLTKILYMDAEDAEAVVKSASKNAEDAPMTMPPKQDPSDVNDQGNFGHPATAQPKPPPPVIMQPTVGSTNGGPNSKPGQPKVPVQPTQKQKNKQQPQ